MNTIVNTLSTVRCLLLYCFL